VEGRMQSRWAQLLCDGPVPEGQLGRSAIVAEVEAAMEAAYDGRVGCGQGAERTDDVVKATESVTGCVTDDEVVRVG
jgi:hypothetical protein